MKDHAVDSDGMCDSWDEWRDGVENGLEHMYKSGKAVLPIEITSDEMRVYCDQNQVENNSKSRLGLLSDKMGEMLRERDLL